MFVLLATAHQSSGGGTPHMLREEMDLENCQSHLEVGIEYVHGCTSTHLTLVIGSPFGRSSIGDYRVACKVSGEDNQVQGTRYQVQGTREVYTRIGWISQGTSVHRESRKTANSAGEGITRSSAERTGRIKRHGRLRWDCNINPRQALNGPLRWSSSAKNSVMAASWMLARIRGGL